MEKEEQLTETDVRLKALEDEFVRTKSETKQMMLDIRALLMEAGSPLRGQMQNGRSSGLNERVKG
jgi:hypothetical protein